MNDLNSILIAIKELASKVIDMADMMLKSQDDEANAEAIKEEPKKVITLEEVRKVLAGLSRDGYTKEVRDLLTKHGASKLSAIKADEYESILKEAEDVANGK